MNAYNDIWQWGWVQDSGTGLGSIFVATMCRNIWKERNNRIFTDTGHTTVFYSSAIANNVHTWTEDLSGGGLQHHAGLQEMVNTVDA